MRGILRDSVKLHIAENVVEDAELGITDGMTLGVGMLKSGLR